MSSYYQRKTDEAEAIDAVREHAEAGLDPGDEDFDCFLWPALKAALNEGDTVHLLNLGDASVETGEI